MWKYIRSSFLTCILFLMAHSIFANDKDINSPVGFWKTIDDVTGKPKAIIQIMETSNQTLIGRILKIYPQSGQDQNEICTACEGERHNKRIVGMVILEKLQKNKDQVNAWHNGKILDPRSGKIYHCNLNVVAEGKKLNVRGYLGLPLFGRSQTWVREPNPRA